MELVQAAEVEVERLKARLVFFRTLLGGGGNDLYTVDSSDDVIVEGVDAGLDTVNALANNYTLGANVERLVYFGSGDFNGDSKSDILWQGSDGTPARRKSR